MQITDTIETWTERIRTMDRKKLVLGGAAALAVIAAVLLLTGRKEPVPGETVAEQEPLAVQVMIAAPKAVESVVAAVGVLSSRNNSVLSAKIMGTVQSLSVREGDYVTTGQTLMRIDSGEITAQVQQAQAAYNNAKLHYDRIKRLYDENAATQIEMDQATLQLETAEAGLKSARAMQSYTVITAPIAGQVVEKRINLGEMASPGQPLLRIEDNRNLRLEVTVRENDIVFVRRGSDVRFAIDALPGKEFRGRVSQVVPASDVRTHSFVVKVDVPAEKNLITGMYGKAFFPTGKREAILVPRTALVEMAGLSGVYVISPQGRAVYQVLQLGAEHPGGVEVLAGLKPGDRIITGGFEGRIEGRPVRAEDRK